MSVSQSLEDATWPSVPLSGVTELRVHGVGGTPPADMLDEPEPFQVSGDRTAGTWRASPAPGTPTRSVEAYAWGGLTARPLASAMWLLVLPLALINLAGWMCPARDARGTGLFRGAVRSAGVAVTLLYVGFACVVGMDFVAYQCAGATDRGQTCAATPWWLIGDGGAMHDPALRVLAGAVVPMALVTLLGVLARRSRKAYEEFTGAEADDNVDGGVDKPAQRGLGYPGFWRGEAYGDRLAELQLAAGVFVVAYIVSGSTADLTDSSWARPVASTIAIALVATLVLASATRLRRVVPQGWALRLSMVAMAVSAAVTVAAPPANPDPPTVLIAVTEIFNPLVGAMPVVSIVIFLMALFIGLVSMRGRGKVTATLLLRHAATPASLVVIAFMLTLTFLSGLALTVAYWVGDARAYQSDEQNLPAVEYAQAFEVLARALPLLIVVFLVAAVVAWLVAGRGREDDGERTEHAWALATQPPDWRDGRESDGGAWTTNVSRAQRFPRQSLAALEWGAWTLSAVTMLATLVWLALWQSRGRGQETPHVDVDLGWFGDIPLGPCLLLLTSIVAGGIYAIRHTLASPTTRRLVAITWDVATFWPRSFQPLGPPSYAERAVPELAGRIARLMGGDQRLGSVLFLGHSQGSVLVAAVVAGLPADQLDRLEVITYGCPLSRLYGRHFPAYFDTEDLEAIVGRLGRTDGGGARWANAFRDTDYVGHRVFPETSQSPYDAVDVFLADPPHPFMPPGDPAPPIRRHSEPGFRRQVAFQELREAATMRLSALLPP